MPILIVVLAALFGVGYFAQHEWQAMPRSPGVTITEVEVVPPPSRWALGCKARLEAAAREFDKLVPGCNAATPSRVEIDRLPSGAEYVEYFKRTADGVGYQVTVTEEPQNDGEKTGWQGAPGCRGFEKGVDVVRHDNGHLAHVFSDGSAMAFSSIFQGAVDFCVESSKSE